MTEKDLYKEMTTTSEKWEDFRGQPVGDRTEEIIGSLHAEVLACHGLVCGLAFLLAPIHLFVRAHSNHVVKRYSQNLTN